MDLRIGDAERDAVTEALHEHFAMGRLTRAELDERLGAALGAKTERDLREVLADLPAPHGLPHPVQEPMGHPWHRHPAFRHGRHPAFRPGLHPRHRHHPPAPPILFLLFLVGVFFHGPGTAPAITLVAAVGFSGALFAFVHRRRRRRRAWR